RAGPEHRAARVRPPPLPPGAHDVAGGDARHAAARAGARLRRRAPAAAGHLRHRRAAVRAAAFAGGYANGFRCHQTVAINEWRRSRMRILAVVLFHVIRHIAVGGAGGWDYVTVDPDAGRVYQSHSDRVEVVDIKQGKVVGTIANTQGVHGIALAPEMS